MARGYYSDYLANALLDHEFDIAPYTPPAMIYYELYNILPASDGTGGSPAPPARVGLAIGAGSFSSATDRVTTNIAAINFGVPAVNWGELQGVVSWDALTGGNMLRVHVFSQFPTVNAGDPAFILVALSGEFSFPLV